MPPSTSRAPLHLAACVTLLAACADSQATGPITDPQEPWPPSILALGALTDGEHWQPDGALAYRVGHPLWSGGTDKLRHLILPDGALIDDRVRDRWRFPPGTVAFKTFLAEDRPIETRALRQLDDGEWDYAAYLWQPDGADAELLPLRVPVPIDRPGGELHTVPSRRQCRECHETAASPMLGIQELQLATASTVDGDETELERFAALGLLRRGVPAGAAAIDNPDPDTAAVLGWLLGNCAHCHNGSAREGASFDLAPGVALANTIDRPTESSASAAGIRIVAGRPHESILYLAVSGEHDDPELRDMPPLGIDRRDTAAIARLRRVIEELEP
jgi:hypothetical protein